MELGLVHVYTGNGKGKTTAAVGAGLRASGQGLDVHMVQFMKGEWFPQYGEIKKIKKVEGFSVEQYATKHFIEEDDIRQEDREKIEEAMKASREAVDEGYDLVILDEINVAHHFGLVSTKEVLELVEEKHEKTELLFTGRYAPEELTEKADLVTEMEKVKHPYDDGVDAREGIEW